MNFYRVRIMQNGTEIRTDAMPAEEALTFMSACIEANLTDVSMEFAHQTPFVFTE